jgi:predicted CopG family antitoxin
MGTTIQLSEKLAKKLQSKKGTNETYGDVIRQLVEEKFDEEKEKSGASEDKQYLRLTNNGWVEVRGEDI